VSHSALGGAITFHKLSWYSRIRVGIAASDVLVYSFHRMLTAGSRRQRIRILPARACLTVHSEVPSPGGCSVIHGASDQAMRVTDCMHYTFEVTVLL